MCVYLQEIARHLRPRTIRAKFGKDKIKNAVHCTDLPDDGMLEVCVCLSVSVCGCVSTASFSLCVFHVTKDRYRNTVHSTDLQDDGMLEASVCVWVFVHGLTQCVCTLVS